MCVCVNVFALGVWQTALFGMSLKCVPDRQLAPPYLPARNAAPISIKPIPVTTHRQPLPHLGLGHLGVKTPVSLLLNGCHQASNYSAAAANGKAATVICRR